MLHTQPLCPGRQGQARQGQARQGQAGPISHAISPATRHLTDLPGACGPAATSPLPETCASPAPLCLRLKPQKVTSGLLKAQAGEWGALPDAAIPLVWTGVMAPSILRRDLVAGVAGRGMRNRLLGRRGVGFS